jgi:hypothetical protein
MGCAVLLAVKFSLRMQQFDLPHAVTGAACGRCVVLLHHQAIALSQYNTDTNPPDVRQALQLMYLSWHTLYGY